MFGTLLGQEVLSNRAGPDTTLHKGTLTFCALIPEDQTIVPTPSLVIFHLPDLP